MAEKINLPGTGSINGRVARIGEVTLASGTASIDHRFHEVLEVFATQKGASATAEKVSWSVSGDTLTLDSSDGASTSTFSILALGRGL